MKSYRLGTSSFTFIANDGTRNSKVTYSVRLSNSAARSLLKIAQNGIAVPVGPLSITSIASNNQGAIDLNTGVKTLTSRGAAVLHKAASP